MSAVNCMTGFLYFLERKKRRVFGITFLFDLSGRMAMRDGDDDDFDRHVKVLRQEMYCTFTPHQNVRYTRRHRNVHMYTL